MPKTKNIKKPKGGRKCVYVSDEDWILLLKARQIYPDTSDSDLLFKGVKKLVEGSPGKR